MRTGLKSLLLSTLLGLVLSFGTFGQLAAQTAQTGAQAAVSSAWTPVLSPDDLETILGQRDDVQIIDIRAKKYADKGTLPGAISIPYRDWRGPSDRPGQPPDTFALAMLLSDAGIHPDRPIVIANHSGKTLHTGQAAYIYWLLKTANLPQLAILHGGVKAWGEAELAIDAAPTEAEPTVAANLMYNPEWWASPVEIFAVATGQKSGSILDARLDNQVKRAVETGKPLTSMPFAQYVPTSWFTDNITKQSLTDVEKIKFIEKLETRGVDINSDVLISVCQTGELSALSWFYASEIVGLENVQYYPDALQGWTSDGGNLFGLKLEF